MANVKISGLPAASAVADANEFEINEAGTSKKVTGSQIASYVSTEIGALTSSDLGTTVQPYDVDTAKYDATTANFTGTLQNGGSNVVVDTDIGSTVQAYDADTTKNDVANTFTAKQTINNQARITGTSADGLVVEYGQLTDSATTPLVYVYSTDTSTSGGPSYNFNTRMNRYISNYTWSRQSPEGATSAARIYSAAGTPGSTQFYLYEQDNGAATSTAKVQLNTSGNSYFTGGNVGIGTSSPAYKLDVSGVTRSTSYLETVYAVTGTTPAIAATNGNVQTWTLSGNSTPTDSLNAGESITLMIDDGSAYTITWTSLVDQWIGGSAPTLATTGYTVVELWKVGTTVYGAYVGDAS